MKDEAHIKVSVIIPVYNGEKYLDRCITSFLKQTYDNIEIILINDGSTDKSQDILNSYKKYNNIIVIQQKNIGVANTRNFGISIASGKYIMFADDDDYVLEDYVETYVKEIQKNDYDLVIGGYQRKNDRGKNISRRRLKNTYWSRYIIMAPWSKIYLKDFIVKHSIKFLNYPIGEDNYFTMSLLEAKPKINIINYDGYIWFYNENSVSNTKQKGIRKNIDIFNLLNELINKVDHNDKYIKYYFYKYCVWYLLFSGKTSSKSDFVNQFNNEMIWLDKNKMLTTISPFSVLLKGESLRDRFAVLLFKFIFCTHSVKFFAKLYCHGE